MIPKARSDSILHGLPPEQRERVDVWLFEEKAKKVMEIRERLFGPNLPE